MVYVVSYETMLALWWDPRRDFQEGYKYRVWINDKCIVTDQILYDFKNLEPGTSYDFTVELLDEKGNKVGKTEYLTGKTAPYRKKVDMTKPPFNLVGDGVTDYTEIINKALNECKSDECLYFPLGRYVCKKLNFSGHLKIQMDAGAVFCNGDKEMNVW